MTAALVSGNANRGERRYVSAAVSVLRNIPGLPPVAIPGRVGAVFTLPGEVKLSVPVHGRRP
jgi:hypothetical protein